MLIPIANDASTDCRRSMAAGFSSNRPTFEVSAEELRRLAAYELVQHEHVMDEASVDQLGRSNVWWDNVWLKLPDTHVAALNTIKEEILQGRKSSTYKPVSKHSR